MIGTVLHITWLNLMRDRVALVLTFLLPIAFFSIFASVFSAMDPDGMRPVRTTVIVDPNSEFATAVARRLAAEPRLEVEVGAPPALTAALESIRKGRAGVVILLPAEPPLGFSTGTAAEIEIHADRSNPLAAGLVEGLVRSAAAAVAVEGLMPIDTANPVAALPVRIVDVLGRTGKRPSIAFFAAGLGVMFLMFAVTGRSAILLEERESGLLSRLLAARVGLARLLAGRWLFLSLLGSAQVAMMFLWAAVAFGLDLFTTRHLIGFGLVTMVTAAAAAAFGLVLSTACRTRAQLNSVAVVVILTLCALGGNMFPSFLMPEKLQAVGRLTFNAWALTAYQKIFWYERPLADLLPQLSALIIAACLFFFVALAIARGWQRRGGLVS